jgi:hypothetical protein
MDIKVRNFPIGKTWKGYNLTPHDEEPYLDQLDKGLLFQQVLWNTEGGRDNYPIYPNPSKNWKHDLNLVLCETNHHFFYDPLKGKPNQKQANCTQYPPQIPQASNPTLHLDRPSLAPLFSFYSTGILLIM